MMKIQDLSMMEILSLDRSDRRIQGGEGISLFVEVLGIEGVDSEMSNSLYTILDGNAISVSVFSSVETIPGGMISVSRSSSTSMPIS